MPEANTRLAALRSGQVDWIEVPPPDAIPSLRSAGFTISTGSYPHV
jgi:ABC-type transport system substrate-binding protein